MSNQHVTEDEWIAWLCRELSEERKTALDEHAAQCRKCRMERMLYESVFEQIMQLASPSEAGLTGTALTQFALKSLKELKVYYAYISPVNFSQICVAVTVNGLAAVLIEHETSDHFENWLHERFPEKWLIESEKETTEVRRQLQEYFEGKRTRFELEIDESVLASRFQKRVLWELKNVPFGRLTTYGELAERIGQPGASRAVGGAMGSNPIPIVLPCHRVIAGDQTLGGFSAGLSNKKLLLAHEGVTTLQPTDQMDLFSIAYNG